MIELAFSESAAGGLKIAKAGQGQDQEENRLGGTHQEVAGLTLALDMGAYCAARLMGIGGRNWRLKTPLCGLWSTDV